MIQVIEKHWPWFLGAGALIALLITIQVIRNRNDPDSGNGVIFLVKKLLKGALSRGGTYSDLQYKSYANQIHESLAFSAISDQKAEAKRIVMLMQNETDLLKLVDAYGRRQKYVFGLPSGGKLDLPQTILDELSRGAIEDINEDYREKGIPFQF